jgi:methyltransferase family protein
MATNYEGTSFATNAAVPHLGGNVREGDPYTFAPKTWSYVIERFSISSVLDLGSGAGYAADWFFRRGLRTVAVDGLTENVRVAVYPTIAHDLTRGPITTNVDLVHCQEVVEHIEEQFLPHLIATMSCGRVVLLTHARPGELGHHHVNLQPEDYWIQKMVQNGYALLAEDTQRVRNIAASEDAHFLQRSGLLFHKRSRRLMPI